MLIMISWQLGARFKFIACPQAEGKTVLIMISWQLGARFKFIACPQAEEKTVLIMISWQLRELDSNL